MTKETKEELEKNLAVHNKFKEEVANAILCFKETPVPTGLYVYRNQIDITVNQIEKAIKKLEKTDVE